MIIATASHRKFPEATREAEIQMPGPDTEMEELVKRPTKYDWMKEGEDWEHILRTRIEHISEKRAILSSQN